MALYDTLPHLCDLKKSVQIADDFGGDLDDLQVVELGRACWVQPASDSEITQFQRRDQAVTHKVYFRGDPGVRPGYVVEPTSGPFLGASLEVRSSAEATVGTGLLWRVMCEEVQPR